MASMIVRLRLTAAAAAIAFTALATNAHASSIVLTNGNFASTGNGQVGYNTTVAGWTTTGYNFVFAPGTASTTGANVVVIVGPDLAARFTPGATTTAPPG